MSSINAILIDIDNLSDMQQLELWSTLFKFADDKLESDKDLMVFTLLKNNNKNRYDDDKNQTYKKRI